MELRFMTPTEVWEGFDPTQASLEASIISSKTTDNFASTRQIFTADTAKDGRVRACLDIYCDARWQDERPAILILPSFENHDSLLAIKDFVEEGYVVGVLDYCGTLEETQTTFPQSLSYAKLPDCKNRLDAIETNARNTPWFVWSKIARRAISLLNEQSIVQKNRIGVLGFGVGSQLSWLVAGTDNRVTALVAINGGGYRWASENPRFSSTDIPQGDEQLAYSTGVGAETYAMFVTCPTLIITTRDSLLCDVDRAADMYDLVKSAVKQMIVSVSCGIQITQKTYRALLLWLRNNLAQDAGEQIVPGIRFETTDGRLYVRLTTAHKASKRTLYVSYGELASKERYYQPIAVQQKVGEHEYICDVPVYDADEPIVAYATFEYPDGNVISTRVVCAVPSKHGVEDVETTPRGTNIIYDSSMGLGSFIAKTDSTILDEDVITLEKGPFGIDGITAKKGNLTLIRSLFEMRSLSRLAALHVDAFAKDQCELYLSVFSYPELKKYTAHTHLKGGEFWQKLLFECTDFKSEEGRTLSTFANVKMIELVNVEGVAFNNFLWI